ncbi:polysaccharide deacetylase family protein [Micromonospora sp. NPDC003197]
MPIVVAVLAAVLLVSGVPWATVDRSVARAVPSAAARSGASGSPEPTATTPIPTRPASKYATRLPRFAPPPTPQPVTVPDSPNAAWYHRIPTNQPVAFITIDDGWVKHPEARELLAAAGVPVTLFLTIDSIKDNPDYFRQLQSENVTIEAHTISHPSLRGQSYALQRRELCGSADQLGTWYGRRPIFFRPPFGNKDTTTLKAARDCGMKAGFFWTETVHEGKVRYQKGKTVQAGDILLMHFRPAFVEDFIAALVAIHRAGLTPALLSDYVR